MHLQARFILAVVNGELTVNNQTRSNLICSLEQNGYSTLGEKDKGSAGNQQHGGFDYLLRMPVRSLDSSLLHGEHLFGNAV